MARQEGIEDLGFEASLELREMPLASDLLARIRSAPTLLAGIRQFGKHCGSESSRIAVGLTPRQPSVEFWHLGAFEEHSGLQVMEVYFVMAQLGILSIFLGADWQPPVIGLQAPRVSRHLRGAFPDTRFVTGQSSHFVRFPRVLLSAPLREPSPEQDLGDTSVPKLPDEIVASLRLLLETYVPDGSVALDFAAEVTGLSRRTLQRRLAEAGLSFSALLDQVRFKTATRLISDDPTIKLLDVAQYCGYDDPSHFSRAFRRLAGVTPSQFRRIEH